MRCFPDNFINVKKNFILKNKLHVLVSATYEYTAACVPKGYASDQNYCKLTIISANLANINISTAEETISFTLPPGQVYEKDYDYDLHPTQGMENKAIRIASDVEVQAIVYKTDSIHRYNDVYMVPNHIRENNVYFISSHPRVGTDCGSSFFFLFFSWFFLYLRFFIVSHKITYSLHTNTHIHCHLK